LDYIYEIEYFHLRAGSQLLLHRAGWSSAITATTLETTVSTITADINNSRHQQQQTSTAADINYSRQQQKSK
jgi:hypothetical protein